MSLTQKRINQIIKEELNRALADRGMNEGRYGEYYIGSDPDMRARADHERDEYLSRWDRDQALAARKSTNPPSAPPPYREPHPMTHHYEKQFAELDDYIATGRLPRSYPDDSGEMNEMMGGRGPEHTPGTPEYRWRQELIASGLDPDDPMGKLPPAKPRPDYDFRGGYTPRSGSPFLSGEYSEYDHLREADDDMDMDAGIDVVPDEDMGGEDMGMGDEAMMEPLEQEIDWTQFEDDDADAVGAAFLDAVKQLQEEVPEESPSAEAVVARMQELLAGESEEDMGMDDEMGIEEEEPTEDMDEEKGEDHGAMNEWVRRANLLAGTSRSR